MFQNKIMATIKTDYLGLGELKIFQNARAGLPKDLGQTSNLLTIRDSVLYVWNFTDSCVLTLNVKAARSREGDAVSHQSLLPYTPVLFKPEILLVNDNGTLLLVAGPSGILVMELPMRYPPHGAFDHNKELVYCRSYSLDERLLLCSETVEVRQVKFHPGSNKNTHILVLTSDNCLRLYTVENEKALCLGVFQIGDKPTGRFPGSKQSLADAFGEVGVDFDFGHPELDDADDVKSPPLIKLPSGGKIGGKSAVHAPKLVWPVYVLKGDGSVFSINIPLSDIKSKLVQLKGPLSKNFESAQEDNYSAIICLNTNPQIVCMASSNGRIHHSLLLPMDEDNFETSRLANTNASKRELLCFENVELELGLATSNDDDPNDPYRCPIFLHKDESTHSGRYFATHSAGVHSITVTCLVDLHRFIGEGGDDNVVLEDVFLQESKAEYLICTKTATSKQTNPVAGFGLYYEPPSILTWLANGDVVSLALMLVNPPPKIDELETASLDDDSSLKPDSHSPLKVMLREPFDQFIQKLLKPPINQPILKLSGGAEHSQKECYELLQRASQVFREHYFENNSRAREEIERRVKTLQMMLTFQLDQLDKMNGDKQLLQEKAESLAEKYEDIKDKQDVIMKRCERLLQLVSQKKSEPSDAEKDFFKDLAEFKKQVKAYQRSIDKLKMKVTYQKLQMDNWRAQEVRDRPTLSEKHTETITNNLKETSQKIAVMVKQVHEYKDKLNIK